MSTTKDRDPGLTAYQGGEVSFEEIGRALGDHKEKRVVPLQEGDAETAPSEESDRAGETGGASAVQDLRVPEVIE